MIALHPAAIQISHPFKFEEDPGVQVIRVIGRGDPLPEDCDAIIVDDSHGKGREYDPSYARDAVRAIDRPGHPCRGPDTGECRRGDPAGPSVRGGRGKRASKCHRG